MDARTHRRITEAVSRWLGLDEAWTYLLCDFSTAPDVSADYSTKVYVTPSGRLRVRQVRVRHHGAPLRMLKSMAVRARHRLLESLQAPEKGVLRGLLGRTKQKLERKALEAAGRLLHYLQDGSVPAPGSGEHDRVERGCHRVDPVQFRRRVAGGDVPVGKLQTLSELVVQPCLDPREAVEEATLHSYRVLGGILGPAEAPEELNSRAVESFRHFKSKSASMLLCLLPGFLLSLLASVLRSPLYLLPLSPYLALMFLVAVVAISGNINRVLRTCQKLHAGVKAGGICGLVPLLEYPAPLALLAPFVLVVPLVCLWIMFLRHPAWKVIRHEVDWFLWKM